MASSFLFSTRLRNTDYLDDYDRFSLARKYYTLGDDDKKLEEVVNDEYTSNLKKYGSLMCITGLSTELLSFPKSFWVDCVIPPPTNQIMRKGFVMGVCASAFAYATFKVYASMKLNAYQIRAIHEARQYVRDREARETFYVPEGGWK